MADFEWVTEVPLGRGPSNKYRPLLDEIAKKPGEWARIPMNSPGGASAVAGDIRRGKKAPGKWEAVSRALPDGAFVYVRYIGPE